MNANLIGTPNRGALFLLIGCAQRRVQCAEMPTRALVARMPVFLIFLFPVVLHFPFLFCTPSNYMLQTCGFDCQTRASAGLFVSPAGCDPTLPQPRSMGTFAFQRSTCMRIMFSNRAFHSLVYLTRLLINLRGKNLLVTPYSNVACIIFSMREPIEKQKMKKIIS